MLPRMTRIRGLKRKVASHVSTRSRRRKIAYFDRNIPASASVLVVGVSGGSQNSAENLIERWLFEQRETVGMSYDQVSPGTGIEGRLVRGDARALPFADRSFDYVVSNAVIEHVGGPGGAKAMLAESSRVARVGYLHTTPNRRFPVETHTRVLLRHWAPRRMQERLFAQAGFRFTTDGYWLFTPRSARRLSPSVRVDRLGAGMTFVIRS